MDKRLTQYSRLPKKIFGQLQLLRKDPARFGQNLLQFTDPALFEQRLIDIMNPMPMHVRIEQSLDHRPSFRAYPVDSDTH
ncbi:MAG: hypothetical protein B7X49_15095 [Acidiphilium sp. 34-64-41]|nr:MAG: hypothetical protein B7X49_15095 [Acidiphilium sp. 34-64-41]HQT82521.1 hypothetical protein [Ferrovaceae bacterium]